LSDRKLCCVQSSRISQTRRQNKKSKSSRADGFWRLQRWVKDLLGVCDAASALGLACTITGCVLLKWLRTHSAEKLLAILGGMCSHERAGTDRLSVT